MLQKDNKSGDATHQAWAEVGGRGSKYVLYFILFYKIILLMLAHSTVQMPEKRAPNEHISKDPNEDCN